MTYHEVLRALFDETYIELVIYCKGTGNGDCEGETDAFFGEAAAFDTREVYENITTEGWTYSLSSPPQDCWLCPVCKENPKEEQDD